MVALDEGCRRQQFGEGWFPTLEAVPTHAFTLTVPAVLRAKVISCVVPDARKAEAVAACVQGATVGSPCPATALRAHPACTVWVDAGSSRLLRDPALRHHAILFPGFVDLQVFTTS